MDGVFGHRIELDLVAANDFGRDFGFVSGLVH